MPQLEMARIVPPEERMREPAVRAMLPCMSMRGVVHAWMIVGWQDKMAMNLKGSFVED